MSKNSSHQQTNIRNKTTKEKLSFFSVMLITVGSCIGAGIFFKNHSILENTGSILMTVVAWLIAIIGILAIAFTLTDLVFGSGKYNSLGIIGWIRAFCGDYIYKGFRNFMMYIYLPTNFFFMPYYAVMSIQDSFNMFYGGVAIPFWLVILLSASIMIYFSITCALSTRTANIQNYIVTTVKFIPLLFAIIAGIGIFAMNHGHLPNPLWQTKAAMTDDSPKQFYQFSPVLGVVASVPAIFFAFDGFYSSSASQHKMHEPKRASQAMSLGIAVVAAVYILISIALLIGADGGSFFGLSIDTLKNALWWKIIMAVMLIFIAFAVFGVINGFAIYGAEFFRDLIKRDEAPLSTWYKNKFRINDRVGITLYTLTIYLVSFVVFTTIGCFYFTNGPYQGSDYYGDATIKLYNFCDLVSNWTSLIIFVGLGSAIFGALLKKHRGVVRKTSRWFTPMAIIGVSLTLISILYEFTATFYDLSSSIDFTNAHNNTSLSLYVIPAILQTILLLAFTMVIALSGLSKKTLSK